MSDRRFIAEHRRRVPEAVQPLQTAVAPQERLLALARGAGNAAIARMLGSAPGRTLMRTRSAAGDLGTADEVADLLEGREPAPRPRSFSAPPALLTVPPAAAPALGPVPAAPVDTAPLAPAPPLEEAHDEPSEPATVEAEPEAAATVEAPADVAVPTTAPEKKPRIPKSPQPLPTHPTISAEKQGTFDVQAHAQFVRDALKLAFQGNAENEKVLYTRYAEVVEIASGRSTDPAAQQRTKIANAEAAYKPLHEALEKRQQDVLADAEKADVSAYRQVSRSSAKARALVARYEWPQLVAALDGLEKLVKVARELEELATTAAKGATYLKAEERLNMIANRADRSLQKQDLATIEGWVMTRHAAPDLAARLKQLGDLHGKVGRVHSDIEMRPTVEGAIDEPLASPDKPQKKRDARAALKLLLDNGVIRRGRLVEKYRDYPNGPDHYGVEWTLEGTERIVVHSHVDADGNANDDDATHFKLRGTKLQAGKSIGMPNGYRGDVMMKAEENKKAPCPYSA